MRLEGEDAKAFDEYMTNPTYTKKGLALIKEAMEIVEREKQRVIWDPPV